MNLSDLGAMGATPRAALLSLALPPGKTASRLEFFPLHEGRIEAAAPQVLKREGDAVELYLTASLPVKADAKAIQGVLVANRKALLDEDGGGRLLDIVHELIELAEARGVDLYFEAAVAGGVPVIRVLRALVEHFAEHPASIPRPAAADRTRPRSAPRG